MSLFSKAAFPLILVLIVTFLGPCVKTGPFPFHEVASAREQDLAGAWAVTRVGNELQIAYGNGEDLPQYGVLHLDSGYFRLNFGPSSGWGTSIVLPPAFWSNGNYIQGTPVTAGWQIAGSHLFLSINGTISSLNVAIQIDLSPPAQGSLSAHVSTSVEGSLPLDDRPGEAFKPVMLSSMHIASTMWDAQAAFANCQVFSLPASGWSIPAQPSLQAHTFGLIGGTSTWKTNAPTTVILLDQPRQVAGWVTPSADPNDDNLGLWAAADVVLSSWSYTVISASGSSLDCISLPLVLQGQG
jgi:hypothetical protein